MQFRRAVLAFTMAMGLAQSAVAWEPEIGEVPRPLVRFEYLDGTSVDLEALRGKPLVLYFGADWCPPCRDRGRPAITAAFAKFKNKGVQFVFVDMDDNSVREAKKRESEALGMPIAMAKLELCPPRKCLDGLRDLGEFGRIYHYPTAFILNSAGVLKSRLQGGRGVQDGIESSIAAVVGQ